MRKSLKEYAKDRGYEDEDGFYYPDAAGLLAVGLLNLCGCGDPESTLLYILGGLELIENPDDEDGRRSHFASVGAEYFFYYWCANEGLEEHGGAVPGWLTDKGHTVLSLLREWRDLYAQDLPAELN